MLILGYLKYSLKTKWKQILQPTLTIRYSKTVNGLANSHCNEDDETPFTSCEINQNRRI